MFTWNFFFHLDSRIKPHHTEFSKAILEELHNIYGSPSSFPGNFLAIKITRKIHF